MLLAFSLDDSLMHDNGNDTKSTISIASLDLRIDWLNTFLLKSKLHLREIKKENKQS